VPGVRGNEHGTACAGLIAASTDNGVGIAGMCPECKLRCVRLIPSGGELVPVSSDVDAFAFALRVDSAVVSNSWGYGPGFPVPGATAQAIRAMEGGRGGKGALVVFAAGNASTEINADEIQAVENVFTVGATNTFDEAAPFSNKGACVAAVAPTGTLTLDISGSEGNNATDYTQNFGGTSSACPLAAGLAALVVSANPQLTAAQVRALMIRTTRPAPFALPNDAGHDLLYGYGVLDARAALEDALGLPRDAGSSLPGDGGVDAGAPSKDAGSADAGGDPGAGPRGCGCGAGEGAVAGPTLVLLLLRARQRFGAAPSKRSRA
jgi:subtilisin family serine protease